MDRQDQHIAHERNINTSADQHILTEKGLAALNAVPKGTVGDSRILACECNDSCAKLVERGRSRWWRDRRLHKEYVGLMRRKARNRSPASLCGAARELIFALDGSS